MARRLDFDINLTAYYGFSTFAESPTLHIRVGKNESPTSAELHKKLCSRARIPFADVNKYPHGHIFDVEEIVQPKDPDCTNCLDIGNAYMMDELARVLMQVPEGRLVDPDFPFRLICRRHNNFMNSMGTQIARLNHGRPFNPTFMRPDDMAGLGLNSGDEVSIATRDDAIPSIVQEDKSLRPGVIAMHHAFGGLVDEDDGFIAREATSPA